MTWIQPMEGDSLPVIETAEQDYSVFKVVRFTDHPDTVLSRHNYVRRVLERYGAQTGLCIKKDAFAYHKGKAAMPITLLFNQNVQPFGIGRYAIIDQGYYSFDKIENAIKSIETKHTSIEKLENLGIALFSLPEGVGYAYNDEGWVISETVIFQELLKQEEWLGQRD